MNSSEIPEIVSRDLNSLEAYWVLRRDLERREKILAEDVSKRHLSAEGLKTMNKDFETDQALLEKYEEEHPGEIKEEDRII